MRRRMCTAPGEEIDEALLSWLPYMASGYYTYSQ